MNNTYYNGILNVNELSSFIEGGAKMKQKSSSKEDILLVAKNMLIEEGIDKINIRGIADKCKLSTGALYNYFSSKEDLMISLVKSVWKEIFTESDTDDKTYISRVKFFLECVKNGKKKYPNFFGSHMFLIDSGSKGNGKLEMNRYFTHLEKELIKSLSEDKTVNIDDYTKKNIAKITVNIILSLFIRDIDEKEIICALERFLK